MSVHVSIGVCVAADRSETLAKLLRSNYSLLAPQGGSIIPNTKQLNSACGIRRKIFCSIIQNYEFTGQ